MLADIGGDVVIGTGQRLVQGLERILRHDRAGLVLVVAEAIPAAPFVDGPPPGFQGLGVRLHLFLVPKPDHLIQAFAGIADHRHVDGDVFVDRGGIDIDVDFLGAGRKGVGAPGDPVIEAGAHIQHHVAVMHGEVGLKCAVHAGHADIKRIGRRKGAEAHQRRGAGISGGAHQFGQQLGRFRPGIHDTAARIDDRPLGRGQQVNRRFDGFGFRVQARLVIARLRGFRANIFAGAQEHVFGDIDQHRAGAAVGCHVKGFVQDTGQIIGRFDQIVMLGRRTGDAGGIGFLKSIIADQVGGNLSGQADQGNGIHQRVHKAGHRVGGAGPRCGHDHARLAGGAGIPFGGVHAALFVTDQDMAQTVLFVELVVERQRHAARIAEYHLHVLIDQRFDDDFTADKPLGGHYFLLDRVVVKAMRGPICFRPQTQPRARVRLASSQPDSGI